MDGEEGPKNNLFDPVKDALDGMKSGAKAGMNFVGKGGPVGNVGKNVGISNGLKSAEKSAIGGMSQPGNNLANVRENESNAGGFYSGNGKANESDNKKNKKGLFKKGGPIGAAVGLLLGLVFFAGGSQVFQPFSLLDQFQETFNSMRVSASSRSNVFLRYQMDSGLVKDPIKSRIFRRDTFKITNKQAAELSARGIEYDDDFDGNGTRVLKYNDGSGEIKIVAADEATANRLTSMDLSRFDTDDVKFSSEAISFKNLYESDNNFFKSYNDGSLTWRGAIANWFGSATKTFLKNNKLTRNLFKNFDQEIADSGDNPRVVATDMIAKGTDEIEEGGVRVANKDQDEEGNSFRNSDDSGRYPATENGGGKTSRASLQSEADVKGKLKKIADDFAGGSITGTAQKVANLACMTVNVIGGISLLVTASEMLQIIHLTTAYFEAIDKTKAGDGDNSPLNTLIDALNERKENTNKELVLKADANINTSDMAANVTDDGISALEVKETTTKKSAMESNGILSLYSGRKVDPNDPSVKSFNFTSSIKRILGGLGTSMVAFETCAFAKMAANAVGAVQSGIEVAACIAGLIGAPFTLGGTAVAGCSGLVTDAVVGAVFSITVSVLMAGLISTITPVVASALTRDLIKNLGGEDLGNALTSGGNMYLGNTHRSNGGSLASREKYINYAAAHQQVIAENAKQERLTRNPFDATSKYTFLGTLLSQMRGFASVDSLSSAITSTSSVVSSSLAAVSPTASAYDIASTLVPQEEYEETCPYLASIGAVGDAFCNPYAITDVSTIQSDPSEVTNILNNNFKDDLTEDGNVKIDGSSDLAKYITFCDNRTSAFGIADQDIVNQVSSWGQVNTRNSDFNNVTNAAIGAVPFIGDLIDVVDNAEALANTGYVGGESCVAGNDVRGQSAPGWETAKYYQRFIEDQSLMESMGLIKESAVAAYMREYYEKNPLDNSYEGILARYSGMKKETVVAILDVMDYVNYIANYDPSERYAFGAPVVEKKDELKFDSENQVAENPVAVLINQVIYADVRNRSFAV